MRFCISTKWLRESFRMMLIVVVRDLNNGMPVACAGVNNDPIIVNLKSALGQGFREYLLRRKRVLFLIEAEHIVRS